MKGEHNPSRYIYKTELNRIYRHVIPGTTGITIYTDSDEYTIYANAISRSWCLWFLVDSVDPHCDAYNLLDISKLMRGN